MKTIRFLGFWICLVLGLSLGLVGGGAARRCGFALVPQFPQHLGAGVGRDQLELGPVAGQPVQQGHAVGVHVAHHHLQLGRLDR